MCSYFDLTSLIVVGMAREEERARKLAKAREAQEEDDARDKKGKWPRITQ
jgi:hypothetical protein